MWLAALVLAWLSTPAAAETSSGIERLRAHGAYVLRAAGCVTCHTDEENDGSFLAGGRALETPFGTFYSPNITFDRERGIGAWQAQDFFRALRHGIAPGGSSYYPVFPYTSYTRMRREDMFALWAYLASVPTAARENTPHQLVWYMRYRIVNRIWKFLFFEPGVFQPDESRSIAWNRGAYLAKAMAHCGECHTPRNFLGAPEAGWAYSGGPSPEGAKKDELIPNITPHQDGIGDWSIEDIATALETGLLPEFETFGGAMIAVQESMAELTAEDRAAIAAYLKSLPPKPSRWKE